jgi:hypothetical protein
LKISASTAGDAQPDPAARSAPTTHAVRRRCTSWCSTRRVSGGSSAPRSGCEESAGTRQGSRASAACGGSSRDGGGAQKDVLKHRPPQPLTGCRLDVRWSGTRFRRHWALNRRSATAPAGRPANLITRRMRRATCGPLVSASVQLRDVRRDTTRAPACASRCTALRVQLDNVGTRSVGLSRVSFCGVVLLRSRRQRPPVLARGHVAGLPCFKRRARVERSSAGEASQVIRRSGRRPWRADTAAAIGFSWGGLVRRALLNVVTLLDAIAERSTCASIQAHALRCRAVWPLARQALRTTRCHHSPNTCPR